MRIVDKEEETEQVSELTEQQAVEQQEQMMKFMAEQLPALRIQEEYNRLIASCDESRLKSLMVKLQYAKLSSEANGPKAKEEKK